jgi:hypothetical protein
MIFVNYHRTMLLRFAEGAEQFRRDVAANPNDTEEAVWAFLCEARTLGFEQARARLLKVGRDSRPYMRTAYRYALVQLHCFVAHSCLSAITFTVCNCMGATASTTLSLYGNCAVLHFAL